MVMRKDIWWEWAADGLCLFGFCQEGKDERAAEQGVLNASSELIRWNWLHEHPMPNEALALHLSCLIQSEGRLQASRVRAVVFGLGALIAVLLAVQ